jgi:hypothetical protein
MEGWHKIDLENFQSDIVNLSNSFLKIEHLIEDTLFEFKH